MENTRRNFLKIAGISALGFGVGSLVSATTQVEHEVAPTQQPAEHNTEKLPEPKPVENVKSESSTQSAVKTAGRWGMAIYTSKLTEPIRKKIISACHVTHNVPHMENKRHEIKWIWEEPYTHAFPENEHEYIDEKTHTQPFLTLCNHCNNPPCVRACPTKATFQRADGIVLMDFHRCIGCRFCMAACPYGSRSFNFRDPRPFISQLNMDFPTRMKGVVEKCNFCAERLEMGKMPACVEVSEGTIVFGDLHDPNSEIRHILKESYTIQRKQNLGTMPSVYYIV
ncbi:MAG: 4Fe-4S dicluster domain-containing protein [Desulfobacterales bacterium]|nr:4Fe-4S dicluster domain-containing protein [Desulfobacterales bacterium]